MKNIRVIVPVIICLAFSLYVIGCGSVTGGGGGGGGGSSNTGMLSDPYIDDAIVIVDVNGSGSYDASVTGEMIATTDAGSFTFPSVPQTGATIEMVTLGTHLGAAYDGELLKMTVDGSGEFNVTPLTNWGTHGITEGAIASLISTAGITIDASRIGLDPMSGLSSISTFDSSADIDAVKAIKAAIFAYSVSRIAVDLYGADYTKSELESMTTIEVAIATAVNAGISDTLLISINNGIDSINTTLTSYSLAPLPYATADQVSRSAFNIAQYIAWKKINGSSGGPGSHTYDWWPAGFDANIAKYGQSLGMRYYFMDNYDYGEPASSYAPAGIAGKKSIVIGLEQGSIPDGFGTIITTFEVNPALVDGFRINTTNNSVESF